MAIVTSGLAWPGQWDQGAWGTASSCLGVVAAVVAAVLAGGARKAARRQRKQIGRSRLVAELGSIEGVAESVYAAGEFNSRQYFFTAFARWRLLSGACRSLLGALGDDVDSTLSEEIRTRLSEVSTGFHLAREDLAAADNLTVAETTTQLASALDVLVERTAELRVSIEQGDGAANAI